MEFRSIIPISKHNQPLDYSAKFIMFGSCFADNISEKLTFFKFENVCNPFGIIFNAVSLATIMRRIATQDYFSNDDIFQHNNQWHCFDVHSKLNHTNKNTYLSNLNQILDQIHLQIKESTTLIITFGSSWVYQLKTTKKVVANCYKLPQTNFSKILLSQEENVTAIKNIISTIQNINPNISFIFTISPIRHLKDGYFENNVSKANLLSAVYQTIDYKKINYFPAYEVMMDDLRDYRFYTNDFLHPTEMAIDYIWEKFAKWQFDALTIELLDEVKQIQKMLMHRTTNTSSAEAQVFARNIQYKIEMLQKKNPHLRF